MQSLNIFKAQIDAMFDKSFKQLTQKNNMNKTILANLMDAATLQSQKINQLDKNIQNLKKNTNPEINMIKNQVQKHQQMIHTQFDKMMHKLSQIQSSINNNTKIIDQNIKNNQQAQDSLKDVLKQLEKIQKQQNINNNYNDNNYHNKNNLLQEIIQFQQILNLTQQNTKNIQNNFQNYKRNIIQPLNNFQNKMAIHNKTNQSVLKEKLHLFTQRIKSIEKKVQEAKCLMNNQISKSNEEHKKIIEEMGYLEHQMIKIRTDLQVSDNRRKQNIQNNAASLDNMIQDMLVETKKLEARVDLLRKGYSEDAQKLKNQINRKKTDY